MDVKKIGVLGMGYVGLTLSIVLAERGFDVEGHDINEPLKERLRKGEPHFFERKLERHLKNALESGKLKIVSQINDCDAYMICVASPLDSCKRPSTKAIESATRELLPHLNNNPLIIVRSTVPVGVTRNKVLQILESEGKKCGKDFSLVFAPERTLEGNAIQELYRNPQIIGGFDEQSALRASSLFRMLTPVIINVSSLEAAEAAKLLDNTSRDFNFGFSNLFAHFCEDNKLDAHEIIKATNAFYPRNNIPVPSPGVGGVCLTKDPRLFVSSSPNTEGLNTIIAVREANERYPRRMLERIKQKLKENGKYLKDSQFFITGFSYKGEPETDDIRDSTTILFLNELKEYSSNIKAYDPLVKPEVLSSLGVQVVDSYEKGLENSDCALFMNNHHSYQELDIVHLSSKMNKPAIIFDAWRVLDQRVRKSDNIHYMSVGL